MVCLWITHDTPLPAGLIVAANSYPHAETPYFPATVVQPLADDLVKVKYQDHGSFTEDRLREDIFLPPPEVDQPNLTQELARLSEADRQYAATAAKAENPFEQ